MKIRSAVCVAVVAGAGAACASSPAGPPAAAASASPVVPRMPQGLARSYEVVASPGGAELQVEARFAPGTDPELTVSDGAEPFVKDVAVAVVVPGAPGSERWLALAPHQGSWVAGPCAAGCRVRYRFDMLGAARVHDDVRVARGTPTIDRAQAAATVQAFASPPSSWLLRPARESPSARFCFHVTVSKGDAFASGVFPAASGAPDTYEGVSGERFDLPYAAIGALQVHAIDGWVELTILPGTLAHEADVLAWAARSARAVRGYYGAPPVQRLLVVLRPTGGSGVGFGTTTGNAGAAVAVDVGAESDAGELAQDWVLVHEMVHTALPDLMGPHHWLEEGLATYVEPIARARAGGLHPEQVWAEWVESMPKGQPEAGDRGLDRTPTWGRTYWGGALFCLLADEAIRERTQGARSLADALRAIDREGGGIASSWPIDRVLDVGDAATGQRVLHELYAKMANAPAPADLDDLWQRLGVVAARGGSVTFDAHAPLASIREGWFEH